MRIRTTGARALALVLWIGTAAACGKKQQAPAVDDPARSAEQAESGQQTPVPPPEHRFVTRTPQEAAPPLDRKVDPSAVQVPEGYQLTVFAKGLRYPTDITFGPGGEAFVSEAGGHFYGTNPAREPPPRIVRIDPGGQLHVVYDKVVSPDEIRSAKSPEDLPEGLIAPVEGVTYNPRNGLLYVAHRSRVSTLDPKTGAFKTIIDGLPAWGIFHNTKVIFDQQGRMIFGVSGQGNSGIVDDAIMKVISFYNMPDRREIPCEDVVLTGRDFSVKSGFHKDEVRLTGAFVPYGVQTEPGQVIKGEFWCNSAMYRGNADGTGMDRIAWGIRNAFHYEISPQGKLVATNNSCNPIPGRPVYDDWETVYEIEEGAWYGWPDYCSSEPITLERFSRPDDPQFKGNPFPHEFVLTEETHRRLLKGAASPPKPIVKLMPHIAAQGFKFGRAGFGIPEGTILLAEFGAVIPYEVAKQEEGGFRVSLVDLATGERRPFLVNRSGQPASAAPAKVQGGGLERPLRLEYGPDGALYVVDFGIFDVAAPRKAAYAGTGVIWRVEYVRSPGQLGDAN